MGDGNDDDDDNDDNENGNHNDDDYMVAKSIYSAIYVGSRV